MSKFDINNTEPIVAIDHPALLSGIQGNILAGHGRNNAKHVFVQFLEGKQQDVKEWISQFSDQVTSAFDQEQQKIAYREENKSDSLFTGFSLSTFGYAFLGFTDPTQQPFNAAFMAGMKNRGALINDPAVGTWDSGFQESLHVLVILASDSLEVLDAAFDQLQDQLQGIAHIVVVETGENLFQSFDDGKGGTVSIPVNHFGYVDGVSQPLFYKGQIERAGTTTEWDPFASLSLVLADDPNTVNEYGYGSFISYRKLKMDPDGFDADIVATRSALGLEATNENNDLVGAYVVGRFKNGTPVINSDKSLPASSPVDNDFIYHQEDFTGSKCPFHAHTRKTNPRYDTTAIPNDGPSITKEMERGHRIARRAISYTYDNGSNPKDVGLLFICYQADLMNQFEFIQASWADENNFVKQVIGQDTLIGQNVQVPVEGQSWPTVYGDVESQKRHPFNVNSDLQKRWIIMKGGEYFFSPSMDFLRSIAK